MLASSLAGVLGLNLSGPDCEITGVCDLHSAAPAKILYISDALRPEDIPLSASCLLAGEKFYSALSGRSGLSCIFTKEPKKSFIMLLSVFTPARDEISGKEEYPQLKKIPGVIICRDAEIADSALLMGNNYIGSRVKIGSSCILHPGVVIEKDCEIGDHTVIHAGTVIGSDGFGYEQLDGIPVKIPQIGKVMIGKHAEIGSNCSIDRATIGATTIGDYVKIDNLVQIAHNVKIGAGSIIVSQAGIAGSSTLGSGVILAGQAGIADHVKIGDGAVIGAQSGIMPHAEIPAKAVMFGSPANPIIQEKRKDVLLKKLPELFRLIKKMAIQLNIKENI
ncbi:MAG: hypothetical protein A2096_03830 [Spirochaetes bacterium GWF1_41_5]|nr:MAG: hypothetical protein A2096_03830 [Spirochaetes bacterium GWF1_41_5]